ncbi:MAG TPA: tRNA (guanosine(37)-N1)-methyltransferase TrmD [Ignavibacteria bacterium]|nr:tRNA (guanosine(37)-N1)-methyltransferase TrmD [Ignavibacteria bacterium]
MALKIDIISANINILESNLKHGLISRAIKEKLIEVKVYDLRNYADGNYKQIDDTPYGGGAGMVLKPEPFFKCISELIKKTDYDEIIYFSPQGYLFNQSVANNYSLKNNILILAGHYKGIDQRVIDKFVTKEISIGEYVLSCGDIAALVFTDAISRLIPGVLNDAQSALSDSFQNEEIFDAPVYTKPENYEGLNVPEILLSGNHKLISEWRMEKGHQNYKEYISKNKKL